MPAKKKQKPARSPEEIKLLARLLDDPDAMHVFNDAWHCHIENLGGDDAHDRAILVGLLTMLEMKIAVESLIAS